MLNLSNSPEGHIDDPSRKLISSRSRVTEAHVIDQHNHPRGQLLSITGGTSKVTIDGKAWSISSQQVVWIQPGEYHEVSSESGLEYCSVFIDAHAENTIRMPSGVMALSALTRELMYECATFKDAYQDNTPESRLVQVLHDQLAKLSPSTNRVPLPGDPRLQQICKTIQSRPWHNEPLSYWSQSCGASERTLARLFKSETGYTFSQWRDHVRVSHAVERLLAGESVTSVTFELGYRSTSAFISMFKRNTGLSPLRYMEKMFEK